MEISPAAVAVGGALQIDVMLKSSQRASQNLVIDYAVHHVKANGSTSPKVFKGWRLELAPGETRRLSKRHSFKLITTRRYHAGRHRIELLVNGQTMAAAEFDLLV
ncbi:hypothetical protein [Ideonella sp. BN130291]|uniref:hypothetical protein n=1 Tax=Ideonella sp. BN130291 TaxID=3112940 RepID=UPI002E268AC7|nr:hypothetical protein [Ideonella sp. BN130291]